MNKIIYVKEIKLFTNSEETEQYKSAYLNKKSELKSKSKKDKAELKELRSKYKLSKKSDKLQEKLNKGEEYYKSKYGKAGKSVGQVVGAGTGIGVGASLGGPGMILAGVGGSRVLGRSGNKLGEKYGTYKYNKIGKKLNKVNKKLGKSTEPKDDVQSEDK